MQGDATAADMTEALWFQEPLSVQPMRGGASNDVARCLFKLPSISRTTKGFSNRMSLAKVGLHTDCRQRVN